MWVGFPGPEMGAYWHRRRICAPSMMECAPIATEGEDFANSKLR